MTRIEILTATRDIDGIGVRGAYCIRASLVSEADKRGQEKRTGDSERASRPLEEESGGVVVDERTCCDAARHAEVVVVVGEEEVVVVRRSPQGAGRVRSSQSRVSYYCRTSPRP